VTHQQPPAQPLLIGVQPVAGHCLGDLADERSCVVLHQVSETSSVPELRQEGARFHAQRRAGTCDIARTASDPPSISGTPTMPSLPMVVIPTMVPSSRGVTNEITPLMGK
jgi:hypothetical protein